MMRGIAERPTTDEDGSSHLPHLPHGVCVLAGPQIGLVDGAGTVFGIGYETGQSYPMCFRN